MKNKLKLGQAAGVVAFAIIIGAVSMSSSSTVDARDIIKKGKQNSQCGGGPWSDRGGRCHRASHSRGYIGSYILRS